MDTAQALKEEKEKNERLSAQNETLKKALIAIQSTSEIEGEHITNTFLHKLDKLQKEKEELLLKVEEEEEMITNQLQKKLKQLQKEKVEMENVLEMEQEAMVNRLQKQLDELLRNSPSGSGSAGGRMRMASTERKLSQVGLEFKRLSNASSNSSINEVVAPSPNVVEMLRAENNALKTKLNDQKPSIDAWFQRCLELYSSAVAQLPESSRLSIPISLPPPPIISSSPSGMIELPDLSVSVNPNHKRRPSAGAITPNSSGISHSISSKRLHARIPLG